MVMLRPGWEAHYERTPAIYPVGDARGSSPTPTVCRDGRYNIMLRGLEKFRILQERPAREGNRGNTESRNSNPSRRRR
jgi:hypothetical protein